MEEFEKKLSIKDSSDSSMEKSDNNTDPPTSNTNVVAVLLVLRKLLAIQERRALAYAKLKQGFAEYMISGGEAAYQQLCGEITTEFNECSKQVLEMESQFLSPECFREDLARLLRDIQVQEKQKLQLTVTIQVLKKAGRPSERLVTHENCKSKSAAIGTHECVHLNEITEEAGTEEAEADAEYDNALKEAIKGVQDVVITINEYLEEVRYEIAGLEAE